MTEEFAPELETVDTPQQSLQVRVEESLVRAREQVTNFGEQISTKVRERPITAVAIAATIGYLGARLLLPRRG